MEGIAENRYVLEVGFPLNLFFHEVVFIDNSAKTSVELMHKYGIKYFKALKVAQHNDFPNTNLVIARIRKSESKKWARVFDDLLILCSGDEYRSACENLYSLIKDKIKPEDKHI